MLYHEIHGTGDPTIVFLSGIGGTTRYWSNRVASLEQRYRLYFVDLLGFGRSPKPWARYTMERHVAELRGVLASQPHFTLVGHSFGAALAVAYAARYPEQVERLVLFSLPYWGGEAQAKQFFRRQHSPAAWLLTNVAFAAVTCVVTRRVLGRLLPLLMPDMPRDVLQDGLLHTWRSSTSTLWEALYRHDSAADAAALPPTLPVLLIHGDQDRTAPVEGARSFAALLTRVVLVTLDGVDHHPLLRRQSWCVDAIRRSVAGERVAAPRWRTGAHPRQPVHRRAAP
jgi:pimeloyl-ACP methyl ester carboxylesterase